MALPEFSMRQLLEAGVHFGHQTRRWNPKMRSYLFGVRNGVHVIDLEQTVPLLHQALVALRDVAAGGGRILFVGTKRQASKPIAETARRCGQYYVNHRWLGGMLTNWKAISGSIKTLADLEATLADEAAGLTKKEMLRLVRRRNKLELALGGIRDMGGVPDVLVVIDTNKEDIAILEARKLGIPVVAIIDSNSDPDLITHPIPGNDDAIRAINLYCDLFARAVIDGLQVELAASGADIGAAEEGLAEDLPPVDGDATKATEAAEEAPADGDAAEVAEEAPADGDAAEVAEEAPADGDAAEVAEEAPADGDAAPDAPADTTADTTADAGAAPPAPEAAEGGGEEQAAGA